MLLLRRLMGAVDKYFTALSQPLVPLVDEFAMRLFGELDYIKEGQSCEKFTELYKNVPNVRTPGIRCVLSICSFPFDSLCVDWQRLATCARPVSGASFQSVPFPSVPCV